MGDLDRVIQVDAPARVSSFLQRMGRTGRREGGTSNCLFLATSDEALLRAAALVGLWRLGYVEPVQAPPEPYHILAQQLMALTLQERGVGRSDWLDWVESVPAFARMERSRLTSLVDSMIASQVLWSDGGILWFAPEGEVKYGRKNFLDLLSVFTSPPLFKVLCGRKELGFVHESTFFGREGRPAVLLLAGRPWRTTHLDWRRRVAQVVPTDQAGKSRWLGQGQFLSFQVCQSVRQILASDLADSSWPRRTVARLGEVRGEFPWIHADSTTLRGTRRARSGGGPSEAAWRTRSWPSTSGDSARRMRTISRSGSERMWRSTPSRSPEVAHARRSPTDRPTPGPSRTSSSRRRCPGLC